MAESSRSSGAIGRLEAICIDVSDLECAATFWGALLGFQPGRPDRGWVKVGNLTSDTRLILQQVPEDKIVKNRVHLDLYVDDVEQAVQQLEARGGTKLEDRDDGQGPFSVMADPDGNEFCIFKPTSN